MSLTDSPRNRTTPTYEIIFVIDGEPKNFEVKASHGGEAEARARARARRLGLDAEEPYLTVRTRGER